MIPEYHQSDLQQDISQVTMNDHHNMDIPPSMSNQSNIHIQKVSETAGSGIFLDICSGVNHPLSSAILEAGGSVCTFDILIRSEDNLLNDESYEALLRLSCSRQVRYGSGSPSCCEYSRLKLKPGGSKALRTLEHMDGIPGLTFAEKTRLQESAIMLVRTITCLRLIYLAGLLPLGAAHQCDELDGVRDTRLRSPGTNFLHSHGSMCVWTILG